MDTYLGVGVGPQEITEETLVLHLRGALYFANALQRINFGTKATVATEDFI